MRRAVFSLLMVCATVASAQSLPAYRHRILGVFNMDGKPLEGVEVTDVKSGTTALTTATGTVSLAYLPDGGSEVRVRQLGYVPVTQFVRIGPADTTPVTVILTSTATILPALVARDTSRHIAPGLRDFDERRRSGRGYFLGEPELRKADNREMPNVVRTIPGIVVSCAKAFPQECHAVSGRAQTKYALIGGGQCQYLIYIDGARSAETNLNMLRVKDYAGIESYTATQIPMQYNATGSACGVLLFWTRER
jgi:hypothetical protein